MNLQLFELKMFKKMQLCPGMVWDDANMESFVENMIVWVQIVRLHVCYDIQWVEQLFNRVCSLFCVYRFLLLMDG